MLPHWEPSPVSRSSQSWERGRFERTVRAPHPALAGSVIGCYEAFTERTSAELRRREVAVPFVPVILNLGEPFRLFPAGEDGPPERFATFTAGLHDRSIVVESSRTIACIQINLRPLAARRIFAVSMGELVNRSVPLDELVGPAGSRLVERLGNAGSWSERFDEVDAFLYDRLHRGPEPADGVRWAWSRLREARGDVRISVLAHEIGWSHKHLIRRFQLDLGLGPKSAARVVRFQEFLRRLDDASHGAVRWSDIALSCGYYDQAHLIRDFRALAGISPTEYVASRIPGGGGIEA